MCGGTHGSPWDTLGMSYVGQSCVGWWILLANLDITQAVSCGRVSSMDCLPWLRNIIIVDVWEIRK